MPRIDGYFLTMVERDASDLHLSSQSPPMVRVHGEMVTLDAPVMGPAALEQLFDEIMGESHRRRFRERGEVDMAYASNDGVRLRVNLFHNRRGPAGVFRRIPTKLPSVVQLGLPATVLNFCEHHSGLVLVCGPTGSGKSTTLASMIDHINRQRRCHILTSEDPIEFIHDNQQSLVSQREIETHTQSFSSALRAALREDPDVILVGELRDLETIELALTAAETGHLVFGTLHTGSAQKSIDRIINVFPPNQQEQIRTVLSDTLKGVISQVLLPRADGKGRIAAAEVMTVTPAISNLIREGKAYQIRSALQTGKRQGMQTRDQAIVDLLNARRIDAPTAYAYAEDKQQFQAARRKQVSSY